MGRFLQPLRAEQVDDDEWKMISDLPYVDSYNILHTAFAGFITDFASTPWPFRLLFKKSGWYNRAAVIHDKMYRHGRQRRYTCDWVMLDAMLSLIVEDLACRKTTTLIAFWRFVESTLFFVGLRIGGWINFRRKRGHK